jgi:hypothetical protein
MDLFSHVLWTSMLTRNKLWQDEAIVFALLPDAGYLLIMLYALFGAPPGVSYQEAMATLPPAFLVLYHLLHSFIVFGIAAILVWKWKPALLPAMSAWALHIIMDIPFHTGMFATRFLYPILPNLSVSGISWADYRLLAVSYFLLLVTWYYLEMRELAKHRRRERWIPDWIDRMERFAAALINPKPIPVAHEEVGNNAGASYQLPGENLGSAEEGEGCGSRTVPPPQAGP